MDTKDQDALEFLYKLCTETRNFEITQLVARNNFFMVFQGVLFAGLAQSSAVAPPVVSFIVCSVGVVASLMQAFMASGAKFWQERWEFDLERVERKILRVLREDPKRTVRVQALFSVDPKRSERIVYARHARQGWWLRFLVRRFSVSRIPIYAGYVFFIFWTLLLLSTIQGPWGNLVPDWLIGFPPLKLK